MIVLEAICPLGEEDHVLAGGQVQAVEVSGDVSHVDLNCALKGKRIRINGQMRGDPRFSLFQ